jgi:topoisomerase-4 subunit A
LGWHWGREYKGNETHEFDLSDLIDIKGWKATGNRFQLDKFHKVENIKTENSDKLVEEIASESLNQKAEQNHPEQESKDSAKDETINTGTSIELDVKPKPKDDDGSQLGMF